MRLIKKFSLFAILLSTVFIIAGCRTSPIYNVEAAPLQINGSASLSDISSAIRRAGSDLGWVMKETGEGKIVGTLRLRDHMARVEITHDAENYNIQYRDSANLKYDGSTIHSNYNGWIQNLERAIDVEVSAI